MSSGLRDSLILLLATGALTGLLAPLVIGVVQTRNQRRLKAYEADIARQSKIIDDQVALLDRFAEALWTYQLLLIAPLYYGQFVTGPIARSNFRRRRSPRSLGRRDRGARPEQITAIYEAARSDYFAQAGLKLGTIRAEIGKAVRLVPGPTWDLMKDLYYEHLLRLDLKVTRLLWDGPGEENASEWQAVQGRVLRELAEAIDQIVERLADDLSLAAHYERNGRSLGSSST